MPLRTISKKSYISKISYENVIKSYFDQDTVNGTDLIQYNKWDDPSRSDAERELKKKNAINYANDR